MSISSIILIPIISAAIGWFTNWIAIKMLFHPRLPKRILGMTFHGVFPKRQAVFAKKMGVLISEKLLSFDDIKNTLVSSDQIGNLKPLIDEKIDDMLKTKLKEAMPLASMFLSGSTLEKLKHTFSNEIIAQLPSLIDQYMQGLKSKLDIEKLVTEKVEAFDALELEAMLVGVLGKEFRFIEIIGAVLGFAIGLLQILIVWITG